MAGRWFVEKDNNDNVIVVNQAFQRRFLGSADPTLARVLFGVMTPQPVALQVVGVVGDVKDVALDAAPEPVVYFPGYGNNEIVAVRTI